MKEMTSRQRLWAVLNRQQPDRVPIWMLYPRVYLSYYADVHHLPSYERVLPYVMNHTDWLDRRGLPAPPFYTAAAQMESYTTTEGAWMVTRSVLHTPYGDLQAESRVDQENAAGTRTAFLCKDIADLDKILAIPYEPAEPDVSEFRQAAQALGEDGLVMVNPGMPLGVAYNLFSPEDFAIYSHTEREALVRFIQAIFERIYTFFKKALLAGAGPVFFTADTEFVAPPLCHPSAFDALVTPFYGPLFDLFHAHGCRVIVHHHGRIAGLVEKFAALGADGIHPVEEPPVGDCPLAEARRIAGDRLCLVGSVQYDDFTRLSGDEMEALVRRQLNDAAISGGMILAPTAGPYAATLTGHEQNNFIRFIEAGKKWGRYPII